MPLVGLIEAELNSREIDPDHAVPRNGRLKHVGVAVLIPEQRNEERPLEAHDCRGDVSHDAPAARKGWAVSIHGEIGEKPSPVFSRRVTVAVASWLSRTPRSSACCLQMSSRAARSSAVKCNMIVSICARAGSPHRRNGVPTSFPSASRTHRVNHAEQARPGGLFNRL